MTALPPDLSGWPGSDRVAVETLDGNQMEMYFDGQHGQHRVDGEAIDYDAYPLYEAPGVDAPAGTGRMTFRKGDQEVQAGLRGRRLEIPSCPFGLSARRD